MCVHASSKIDNIRNKKILIHVIKTFPSSTLNNDEAGRPKTAQYGQILRDRISSQAIKRAVRDYFVKNLNMPEMGCRTRSMPSLVLEKMMQLREEKEEFEGIDDELLREAAKKLKKFGKSDKKAVKQEEDTDSDSELVTNQTVFLSTDDINRIAELVLKEINACGRNLKEFKEKGKLKTLKETISDAITIDMALFGRMVTGEYLSNIDSSVQVAHAMSTHPAYRETDYFSCIDDLIASGLSERTGAAITEYKAFRSTTLYMYSAIDLGVLVENMDRVPDGEALIERVIESYIQAFAMAYPKAGQSAFAAQPFPDMVMIEVQDGNAPTYAYHGAYETPVKTYGQNPEIVKNSIAALVGYVDQQDAAFGDVRTIRNRAMFAPGYADELHPAKAQVIGSLGALTKTAVKWLEE